MTYELEDRLYAVVDLLDSHPGTANIVKELMLIADAVGGLEYRLDSLDR